MNAGDLCGECKDGKGVSALLNRCTNCSDVSGLLIALLCELVKLDVDRCVFIDEYCHSVTGCCSICSAVSHYEATSHMGIPMCLLHTGLGVCIYL